MTSFDKWAFSQKWLFLSRFEAWLIVTVTACELIGVVFVPASIALLVSIVLLSDVLKDATEAAQ